MGERQRLNSAAAIDALNKRAREAILQGKPLTIEFIADSKTERQRGYQFGWFYDQAVIALQDAGLAIEQEDGSRYPYDVDLMHEILKEKVLRPLYMKWGKRERIKAKRGRVLMLPVSTEKDNDGKVITTKEFSEYIEACRRFLWEWKEITVAEPVDGYYAKFAEEMRAAA